MGFPPEEGGRAAGIRDDGAAFGGDSGLLAMNPVIAKKCVRRRARRETDMPGHRVNSWMGVNGMERVC